MTEGSAEIPPDGASSATPSRDALPADTGAFGHPPPGQIPPDLDLDLGQPADHGRNPAAAPHQLSLRDRLVTSSLVTIVVLFFLFTPWPLQEKLRTIGHACCAQIPSHTIRFDGQPMPIDARNSGIYSAVFMVIAILWLTGRGKAAFFVPARIRNVLMLFVVAMVFDGFNSLAHTYNLRSYYPENNTIRTVTGTLAGMALTILVLPLFNRLTWSKPDQIAIADDFMDLVGYFGGAVLIIITLQQAPPPLYYPMSILSIAGLLVMLTFVNTCIALISVRREKQIASMAMFITPALWGLVLTCFEIMAIDYWQVLHG